MAANTNPIFGRTPDVQLAGAILGSSANTATDGTGSNMYQIFEADAAEGSFVQSVRLKAVGTIAATVVRLWFCSDTGTFSAGTTNDETNTTLIAEIAVAVWAASQLVASPVYDIPVNMPIPAGTKLLMSFGTSTGSAGNGFNPLVIGMKY